MSITKKIIMVIVALILVCVIGVLIIASPWMMLAVGLWLLPAPPKPEITYGEFDKVAHGAGLAVLYPAWARYVYKENIPRFAQFARNVWDVTEVDDEKAAIMGIERMAEFFKSIGMPSKISEFDIPSGFENRFAELTTFGETRTVKSYIELGYDEIVDIFKMCY